MNARKTKVIRVQDLLKKKPSIFKPLGKGPWPKQPLDNIQEDTDVLESTIEKETKSMRCIDYL